MAEIYPSEAWLSDSQAEQLGGTTDQGTGLPYIAKGVGPTSAPTYEVQYNRRQHRSNRILETWRQLQVVDEGSLKIGVYPGTYTLGGLRKTFDGATSQSVPDNDTRYAYLDSNNTLQIAASEPTDLTTYLPLAKIVTSGGVATITDRRIVAAFHVPQIEDPADITGTPNSTFHIDNDNSGPKLKNATGALQVRNEADDDYADLTCGTLDARDGMKVNGTTAVNANAEAAAVADGAVTAAKLSSVLQDLLPTCTIQVGGEVSDNIDVTVQLQDANGNNLAQECVVRLWVGDSAGGGECATAPSGGLSVPTGTLLNTLTADKHLNVISDANGTIVLRLADTGTPTYYVMAEFDGRITASSAVTFS
jgi:hypothetical protein